MVATNPDVWSLSVENMPHDPALARVGNFLASGPKRGIIPAGPTASGAVIATPVPSGRVLVVPFVAVAPSPWPGHFGETYVWRSRASREVAIRPASSGGSRTDAIISRIWDEGVDGTPPPGDRLMDFEVIEGVDPGVESATVLAATHGLEFPFVWHANVTLPASQGTVTDAMITDRRYQIGGEKHTETRTRSGDIGPRTLNDRNGQAFPAAGGQHTFFIPEWATRMVIRAKWLGVQYRNLSGDMNVYGAYYVRYGGSGGTAVRETVKPYFDAPTDNAGTITDNWELVQEVIVPNELKGTHQPFHMYAMLGSNAPTERVTIQERSQTIVEVEFRETLS